MKSVKEALITDESKGKLYRGDEIKKETPVQLGNGDGKIFSTYTRFNVDGYKYSQKHDLFFAPSIHLIESQREILNALSNNIFKNDLLKAEFNLESVHSRVDELRIPVLAKLGITLPAIEMLFRDKRVLKGFNTNIFVSTRLDLILPSDWDRIEKAGASLVDKDTGLIMVDNKYSSSEELIGYHSRIEKLTYAILKEFIDVVRL